MNRQFHNMRQSLTVTGKQAGVGDYSTDQKKLTGHMFNIKLEEKPYKMSFKAILAILFKTQCVKKLKIFRKIYTTCRIKSKCTAGQMKLQKLPTKLIRKSPILT